MQRLGRFLARGLPRRVEGGQGHNHNDRQPPVDGVGQPYAGVESAAHQCGDLAHAGDEAQVQAHTTYQSHQPRASQTAENRAHYTDQHSFHQKEVCDLPPLHPQRGQNTHLPGPLKDGHQLDVEDADAGDDNNNKAKHRRVGQLGAERLGDLRAQGLPGIDLVAGQGFLQISDDLFLLAHIRQSDRHFRHLSAQIIEGLGFGQGDENRSPLCLFHAQ